MRYDLHTHSTWSDGTTSPAEIAAAAAEIDLAGFSLTDHDTTDGWEEARSAAAQFGLDFLPGLELTTTLGVRSIHLLAYGVDPAHQELQQQLSTLRSSRMHRAEEMVRRLRRDFEYDWDNLLALAVSGEIGSVGRPHLADALVEGGYFIDRSQAFVKALSPGGPYYVPTETLDTTAAIRLVASAGGVSVLAHPAAQRMRVPLEPSTVRMLAAAGLGGVEIEHPENRSDWIEVIRAETERLGLLITGSSDFHGAGKPNRLGECTTPQATVEQLRANMHTPR